MHGLFVGSTLPSTQIGTCIIGSIVAKIWVHVGNIVIYKKHIFGLHLPFLAYRSQSSWTFLSVVGSVSLP